MSEFFNTIIRLHNSLKSKPHYYLEAHILIGLYYFYFKSNAGRYGLANELMVRDSGSRSLYNNLQQEKLIVASKGRKGASLTEKGIDLCQSLFKNIIFLNYNKSFNLGILSVGTYNSLVAAPLINVKKDSLNLIDIRDVAMRSGASGATIFKGKLKEGQLNLSFYNGNNDVDLSYVREMNKLAQKVQKSLIHHHIEEWVIIAGSTTKKQQQTFLPYIDEERKDLFKISRLAALQSLWMTLKFN